MTGIAPHTTLAALVTRWPHLAGRLDRLGLDYCCGGQRSLAHAVEAAGLALAEVMAELETEDTEPPSADWADLVPDELVDHLEATHHAYLSAALPRLDELAAKVAGVHGERHLELTEVRQLVHDLRVDLEPHLQKEEQVLFPMIRQLMTASTAPSFHCGSLRNPVAVMFLEHDRAGELLAALRSATDDYRVPDDACASYRALYEGLAELEADTHLHVHKENNLLFPAVLAAETALVAAST